MNRFEYGVQLAEGQGKEDFTSIMITGILFMRLSIATCFQGRVDGGTVVIIVRFGR